MVSVKVVMPDLGSYIQDLAKKEAIKTSDDIVSTAKQDANRYRKTGNYQRNIKREGTDAVANAHYSNKLEYIPNSNSGSTPYATMRRSARRVAKKRGHQYV